MNKVGIKNEQRAKQLQKELQMLRKGSGLQPWKLQHATCLRECTAKQLGEDPMALSMDRIYTHLLHELSELGDGEVASALRNAYATSQGTNARGLTARRYDFALQVKRHPDTIKAYENRAIGQLVHRLLGEQVRPAPVMAKYKGGVVPDYDTMSKALQRTVTEGLSGLYALGMHGSEVLRVLGRSRYPYLDASIECTFSPSSRGADWYAYEFQYRFHCPKDVFRIGIVTSVQDSGILMASGLFDEVAQLNAGIDFDSEMKEALRSWQFTAHDSSTGEKQPFEFVELDMYDRHQLLEPVWQIDADSCRVIEVHIPPAFVRETVYYELRTTIDLTVSEHYAYWEAPGLMYVRTITIDVSQFPRYDQWKFFLKPFLGTAFAGAVELSEGKVSFPVNGWITHGHGVAIIWQEAIMKS